jgi:hypothetical protein
MVIEKNVIKGIPMKGYLQNINTIAIENHDFRQVLYTAKYCQIVIMALKPGEEIVGPKSTSSTFDGKTTE